MQWLKQDPGSSSRNIHNRILLNSVGAKAPPPRWKTIILGLAQESWNTAVLPQFRFSHSVVSDSLQPYGLQHARLSCPSPTPGACSNSCPSSQWCHPVISSSVFPFFSCFQSFPISGSFPMSQFFVYSGQSIGASASASVLPMNIQD